MATHTGRQLAEDVGCAPELTMLSQVLVAPPVTLFGAVLERHTALEWQLFVFHH